MSRIDAPLLPAWLRWLAVASVAGAVFYLSVVTVPPESAVVPRFGTDDLVPLDKWRHFLAYAGVGGTLAYATTDWGWPRWRLAALVMGVTVVYGMGIEFWQSFLPARYFSLGDAYANALGAVLVVPWYLVRPHLSLVPAQEWLESVTG